MKVAVVIPFNPDVSEGFYTTLKSAIWLYLDMHIAVFIVPNGPKRGDTRYLLEKHGIGEAVEIIEGRHFPEPNPYPPRNLGVRIAFAEGADWVLLTDADCYPDGNYDNILRGYLSKLSLDEPHIIAGRVETEIPDRQSFHFQTLRAVGFECYGDHLKPSRPVGANMVLNKAAWSAVGPFRTTKRSGGDTDYGVRFEALGREVTIAQDLIVTKIVFNMTLFDIVRKQVLRGYCFSDEIQPSFADSVREVQQWCAEITTLRVGDDYPKFVDRLFKLGVNLGHVCYRADKETE